MDLENFKQKLQGTSITTGVVRYHDLAYLLMTNDELVGKNIPHTTLYQIYQGRVSGVDLQWTACAATICYTPEEQFITVAQQGGAVFSSGRSGVFHENPIDKSDLFKKRGYLRDVKGIAGGRAYAVGTCRQAYRREAQGVWICIDKWALTEQKNITDYSFESIDGFSEEEIYVVGWEGEIWNYDGEIWTQAESPTNLGLHKVLCSRDGYVYVAGKAGILLKGRNDKWEIIEHGITEEDIWGLEWFAGKIFVATTHFLYELDGDELSLVNFGDINIPGTCYHLSAVDGIMWSIGAKDVMQFDGNIWSRII